MGKNDDMHIYIYICVCVCRNLARDTHLEDVVPEVCSQSHIQETTRKMKLPVLSADRICKESLRKTFFWLEEIGRKPRQSLTPHAPLSLVPRVGLGVG